MKSIKEKSDEYANEQDLRMAYNGTCDNCQQGFMAGANYVLEEIEIITKTDLGSYKSQLDRIKKVIERLKK